MNKKVVWTILVIILCVGFCAFLVTIHNTGTSITKYYFGGSGQSETSTDYQCENTLAPFHETLTGADGKTFNVDIGTPTNTGKTLSLADIPRSTYTDDYSLFAEAIKLIKQDNISMLIIPKRTYEIHLPSSLASTSVPILNFSNTHNLIVDGEGSTLHFYDVHNAINLSLSSDVIFKNVIMDWVPSLTAGGVLRHDPQKGTIFQVTTLLENQQWLSPLPIEQLIEYDVADKKWNNSFPLEWSGAPNDPVNGFVYIGIYKGLPTYTAAHFSNLPDGTTFVATIRTNKYTAFAVGDSSNISIENVTIYSSPGSGFGLGAGDEGIMLCDSKIIRNPNDPSRLISTTADAAYFQGDRGNIAVLNNTFQFQGDDGVNVHGIFTPIQSVAAQSISVMQTLAQVTVGDLIRFDSGSTLSTLFQAHITAITKTVPSCKKSCIEQVTFDAPLPKGITTDDYIVDLNQQGENYLVRGNTIEDNRGHGVLAEAENGVVEDNTMERNTIGGIRLMADTSHFKEGPGAENVVVNNNTISDDGYGSLEKPPSGILAIGYVEKNGVISASADYPNQSLLIENNTLRDIPGAGIIIESATNVQLKGNTFDQTDSTIQTLRSQSVQTLP